MKKIFALYMGVLLILAFAIMSVHAASASGLTGDRVITLENAMEYFPIHKGNRWSYVTDKIKQDGSTEHTICTDMVRKTIKNIHGKTVWFIGPSDNEGCLWTSDTDGVRFHGEVHDGKLMLGSEDSSTKLFDGMILGYTFQTPTVHSSHILDLCELQVVGFETVKVPAGIFKNCLRIDIVWHMNKKEGPNLISKYNCWYAKGVGIVRSECLLIDRDTRMVKWSKLKQLTGAKVNGNKIGK